MEPIAAPQPSGVLDTLRDHVFNLQLSGNFNAAGKIESIAVAAGGLKLACADTDGLHSDLVDYIRNLHDSL